MAAKNGSRDEAVRFGVGVAKNNRDGERDLNDKGKK